MTYWTYRNQVLAKTSGADIHTINSKLSIVLNSLSFQKYPRWRHVFTETEIQDVYDQVKSSIQYIGEHTGVWPDDLTLPGIHEVTEDATRRGK